MSKPKKEKVHYKDMPIHAWAPLDEGQPFIAIIGTAPVIFRAKTEQEVREYAENWRREQLEMEAKKKANAAAAGERARARRKDARAQGEQA